MYAVITTRCNMFCAHCCMDATEEGSDMSMAIYRKTLELSSETGDYLSLGGGEPTLHPLFWGFLGLALSKNLESLFIATNGSMTETSIALANLASSGVISAALSLDDFHEPIDESVISAFKAKNSNNNDYRSIRTVIGFSNVGRCDWGEDLCVCPDFQVYPDGLVHVCGCADSPVIGNIMDDAVCDRVKQISSADGYYTDDSCHKNLEGILCLS